MDPLKRSNELIAAANQRKQDLIKADLEVARTSVEIALNATDPAKMLRNRRNARKAYDTVVHFMRTADVDPSTRRALDEEIALLKSALTELGETFPL